MQQVTPNNIINGLRIEVPHWAILFSLDQILWCILDNQNIGTFMPAGQAEETNATVASSNASNASNANAASDRARPWSGREETMKRSLHYIGPTMDELTNVHRLVHSLEPALSVGPFGRLDQCLLPHPTLFVFALPSPFFESRIAAVPFEPGVAKRSKSLSECNERERQSRDSVQQLGPVPKSSRSKLP